jgi:hypothetical protein
MAKIVIWFYVCVSFLEMNLIAVGFFYNPNWPVPGFGSVQILAGAVIVDFLSLLSLVARLLTPKEPKPREPIDLRKTLEYWRFSHFIDGPYPRAGEFYNGLLFIGLFLITAALPLGIFYAWRDAPLPLTLRATIGINSLVCATGPLLISAWGTEFLVVLLIRRYRWRGPPMNKEQLEVWKTTNPGAPMPWECGRMECGRTDSKESDGEIK